MRYLTQEWLDELRRLSADQTALPGANAQIQFIVADSPDGDVHYYWVVDDGRIIETQIGDLNDPDFTLNMDYEVGREIAEGTLEPNVAFMQGRMKCTGDTGKLMALIPITGSSGYHAMQAELRENLEF
ncbi:MAG: SCP2 sterol-binding domain-containing protein [Acidimicrobiia bacterium]|nr:SCP2 sterol-binding domain-containing protein [Acidimicrobiia bacterium]